jgi:hypothetical protein
MNARLLQSLKPKVSWHCQTGVGWGQLPLVLLQDTMGQMPDLYHVYARSPQSEGRMLASPCQCDPVTLTPLGEGGATFEGVGEGETG